MDRWTARTQATTAAYATHHGEGWTSRDLEFVAAFPEATNAELALTLGRTLFAISSIKQAILDGTAVGSDREPAREPQVRLYDPTDFAWSD